MADILDVLKQHFFDNWQQVNTDSKKPEIDLVYNHTEIDAGEDDWCLFYWTSSEEFEISGPGYIARDEKRFVSVDLRTTFEPPALTIRAHAMKMKAEADRLVNNLRTAPQTTGHEIINQPTIDDRSDRSRGFFHIVLNYEAIAYNKAIPT